MFVVNHCTCWKTHTHACFTKGNRAERKSGRVHCETLPMLFCSQIETHSGTLGPFCGHTPPPSPFLTHSHHVKIRLTSDGFGTNKGFSLHFMTRGTAASSLVTQWENNICYEVCWKLITNDHNCSSHMLITGKVCPAEVTSDSTVTPQQTEYRPGETVTVTCDLGHVPNTVSVQRTRTVNRFTFHVFKPLLS